MTEMTNIKDKFVTLAHGAGGKQTSELIDRVFKEPFANPDLTADDAAVLSMEKGKIAFTTDGFIVSPYEFAGGNIGKLSICGTVNDLSCMGAKPLYLSCAFVIEEGFPMDKLEEIAAAMAKTAKEAGVEICAGDTKVAGKGQVDGVFITTTGIGRIMDNANTSGKLAKAGDAVIVSGDIGRHGCTILLARDAEKKSGATLAKKNDSRITPIGKFIRKVRIDELPQLINILKGDMSFVGPRPERPEIAQKYEKTMPEFKYRLKVKAGLTGYAQVMGKYNTTPYDKLKLDLMYIEHQSLMLDLRIFFMTVKTCFIPEATEGVKDSAPLETHRDRIEHDNSKDEKNSEEIKL